RPHVCQVEYCGRAFKRSDQLRRHHKTHEHPNPCPHEKCPRTFNRKDQLAQHLALH
ncbi:erythroid Kruppel-like factor 1 variant, partial [Neoconidiobolus thromboides FSU 785]